MIIKFKGDDGQVRIFEHQCEMNECLIAHTLAAKLNSVNDHSAATDIIREWFRVVRINAVIQHAASGISLTCEHKGS